MERGYVYVLSNKALPGLVKIGFSLKSGAARRSQLSNTSIPHPFDLIFEILMPSAFLAEQEIHRQLSRFRETDDREFFRLDKDSAVMAVIDVFLLNVGYEGNYFEQCQEHKANFVPAVPEPEPRPPTDEEAAASKARARATIDGMYALLDGSK